jgi:hypothetical protein
LDLRGASGGLTLDAAMPLPEGVVGLVSISTCAKRLMSALRVAYFDDEKWSER